MKVSIITLTPIKGWKLLERQLRKIDKAIGEVPRIVHEVNLSMDLFLQVIEEIHIVTTNPMTTIGTWIILVQKINADIDVREIGSKET